jgi:hypothetical protein
MVNFFVIIIFLKRRFHHVYVERLHTVNIVICLRNSKFAINVRRKLYLIDRRTWRGLFYFCGVVLFKIHWPINLNNNKLNMHI